LVAKVTLPNRLADDLMLKLRRHHMLKAVSKTYAAMIIRLRD
jgi:hypothetical protein